MMPATLRQALGRSTPAGIAVAFVMATYAVLVFPAMIAASGDIMELSVNSTDAPLVYVQLEKMISSGPTDKAYGDFMPVAIALATAPMRRLASLVGIEIRPAFYIVLFRLTQLACALLTFFGIYRLTAMLSSPWFGALAVAIVATVLEFLEYTIVLHPDVWQWMAEVFCLLCLVTAFNAWRATRCLPLRSIAWAAVWAGAATASKVNGVFLLPSAAIVILLPLLADRLRLSSPPLKMTLIAGVVFSIVFLATTLAFWPQLVLDPIGLWSFFKQMWAAFEGLTIWQGLVLLTWEKITRVMSSTLVGPIVPAIYLIFCSLEAIRWLRQRRIDPDPLILLHGFVLVSVGQYLLLFRDTFNVHSSEHYILLSMVTMVIVVMVAAHRLLRAGSRVIAATVVVVVVGWQTAQAAGFVGLSGLAPLFTVVQKGYFIRYGSVDLPEPFAARLRSAYRFDDKFSAYFLREDLTEAERNDAIATRRIVDGPATIFSPDFAWYPTVRRFANVENWAGFRIREWVKANIPEGSKILIEFYMSLRDPIACKCDPNYIGARKIEQDRGLIFITDSFVRDLNPDYILTRRETVKAHLLREFPSYQVVATVEGTATTLLDDYAAASPANKFPPSIIFVLRRTAP